MNEDSKLLEALIAHQQNVRATNQEQTMLHENWRRDYVALKTQLSSLSGKLEQGALLPLGPKAFVPGKLIHTNEVTCLLGDNWFLECSSKHAIEIVNRRIAKCDDALKKLKLESDQNQAWRLAAGQHFGELTDENVKEIREEYDEEKEKEWRKAHRENLRKYHQGQAKMRAEGKGDAEFREVMSRLDELELQEDGIEYKCKYQQQAPVKKVQQAIPKAASSNPIPSSSKAATVTPVEELTGTPAPTAMASSVGARVLERQPTAPAPAPAKEKRVSKFKKSRECE